jgi:hypothetical protein
MIEPIEEAPAGVVAFRAVGKVEAEDYEQVLAPAVEASISERGELRLVYELGPKFASYSLGAAWEDLKLSVPHLAKWRRCAIVTDHRLMAEAVRALGVLMPGEVKVFPVDALNDAIAWAAA